MVLPRNLAVSQKDIAILSNNYKQLCNVKYYILQTTYIYYGDMKMNENIDLQKIEKNAWTSYFQDGLMDIFIGCIVLMFALAPILSRMGLGDFWSSFIFLPVWALVYSLIVIIRKYVVTPRIGVVKFGIARKKKMIKFNLIIFIVLVVGFVLGLLSFIDFNIPGWIHVARFGLIVLIASSVAAYFLDYPRLLLYGILFDLSLIIGEWLWANMQVPHHGFPITFGITAAIIIIIGMIVFVRLLHDNPIQKKVI
jgi:hypothetical protein